MNVKELKDKIALKLEACLPKELVDEIKNLRVAMEDAVAPAPVENQIKTKDGKVLSVAGDVQVGVSVSVVNADGSVTTAEDGEYYLEDGSTITVVGGLVTEVESAKTEPAEPATEDAGTAQMNADFKAQMDAQKSEINELKTRLESVTKQNTDLAAALKKILETPINVQQSVHTEVKLEDMTPYQRYKHSLNK